MLSKFHQTNVGKKINFKSNKLFVLTQYWKKMKRKRRFSTESSATRPNSHLEEKYSKSQQTAIYNGSCMSFFRQVNEIKIKMIKEDITGWKWFIRFKNPLPINWYVQSWFRKNGNPLNTNTCQSTSSEKSTGDCTWWKYSTSKKNQK